nr:hypothetical protein [uncultured Allomuricauda sp.]
MRFFTLLFFVIPFFAGAIITYIWGVWMPNPDWKGFFILLLGLSIFPFLFYRKEIQNWTLIYPELGGYNESEKELEKIKILEQLEKIRERNRKLISCFILLITSILVFIYLYTTIAHNYKPPKMAIVGGAFILSLGFASIYHVNNPNNIRTIPEKVSFYSGVSLGPPTIINFLF